MNLALLRPMAIRFGHGIVKNAPHILMAVATGTSITAVIFAIKAAPAAKQAKMDAEFAKNDDREADDEGAVGIFKKDMVKLTPLEWLKACGKYYIPAAGMELFSLLCFWSAHGIDLRRQALLAGLYSTAEQALIEYQKKVVEMIGEKPEREIRSAVAQDQIHLSPDLQTMVFERLVCRHRVPARADGNRRVRIVRSVLQRRNRRIFSGRSERRNAPAFRNSGLPYWSI